MRLSEKERTAIRDTAAELFGDTCRVVLFGSRVDDTQKGGDIDLLIEVDEPAAEALTQKIPFLVKVKQKIGDRKIDLVIRGSDSNNQPIHETAEIQGLEIQ